MKGNGVFILISKLIKLTIVISTGRNSVFRNYFIQIVCGTGSYWRFDHS